MSEQNSITDHINSNGHKNNINSLIDGGNEKFSNRLKWLLENKIPLLAKALKFREDINEQAIDILKTFVNADPSSNKSAVQWLAESYCREGFLYEDIVGGKTSKTYQTLMMFGQFSKHLDQHNKNLYNYRTLSDVFKAIEPYIELTVKKTSNQIKTAEKEQARQQSLILFESDQLKIIIPRTKFAAQWLGKGTQWCTSAQNNNQFDNYTKQASLFICLISDKFKHTDIKLNGSRKLQLWSNGKTIQWMDESDNDCVKYVHSTWPLMENLVLKLLESNQGFIKYVPPDVITQQLAEKIIKKDYEYMGYIPISLRTHSLYLHAVQANAQALKIVPQDQRSVEIYKTALKLKPDLIKQIPTKELTDELYLTAVLSQGSVISWIPKNKLTQEISSAAVKNGGSLSFVPEKFQNQQMYLDAVNYDGSQIIYIPEESRTQKICWIAIKQKGYLINHVPEKFKTSNMVLTALMQDPFEFFMLEERFKTLNICTRIVKKHPTLLQCVPKKYLTEIFYRTAVASNIECLEYVPLRYQTPQYLKEIFTKDPQVFKWFTQSMKTKETCAQAVQKDPNLIDKVPWELRSADLCLNMIVSDPSLIKFVPENIKSVEFFEQAYHQNSTEQMLNIIPEKFSTEKIKQIKNDMFALNCQKTEKIFESFKL